MNVLVTGGAGFAGKYLTEYLAKQGHVVTAVIRNQKPKEDIKRVTFVKQELSERIEIEGEFDAIVHTACSKSGRELSIEEYIRDNVESARQLVSFARRKQIKTIIYFSTRSIYGEIRKPIVQEQNDIINADKYGVTKRIAEQIFTEAEDINTIGLRTPGIIGPEAHDIWLTDIVQKIRLGCDVAISDFKTKNLVWIGDIADFVERLLEKSYHGEAFCYPYVNLACKEGLNNLEIIKIIQNKLKRNVKVTIHEPSSGLFLLDASKAFEMGYHPNAPETIVELYLDSILKMS